MANLCGIPSYFGRLVRRVDAARDERGIALIVALGMLMVFSVSVAAAVSFSTANSQHSGISKSDQLAFGLAEAGINNASAVLNDPDANALSQLTLPSTEETAHVSPYEGGTVKWWGVLSGSTWTIYSKGLVANNPVATRLLTAQIPVATSLVATPNATAWNYLFSTKTGDPDGCDQFVDNSITVDTPIYAAGNLCLNNSVNATQGPIVVLGQLKLINSAYVGSSGSRVSELHVAGGCKAGSNALHNPCRNGSPSSGDNVWANTITNTPPAIEVPEADFDAWYSDASTINGVSDCSVLSGTPPTFDTNTVRDSSVGTVQILTPASSYTCRKTSGGATVAELSWNSSTKILTVAGTIFIDGSARTSTSSKYNGMASLYVSGTFKVSSSLCADTSGSCSFSSWNPNNEMLAIVADGEGGQNSSGVGVQLDSNFQGALYATWDIRVGDSVSTDGPMVGREIQLTNSVSTSDFPFITSFPAAMPATLNVHASPQPVGTYG